MLSHGEQQNDVQYDYLIQEINPNLTDQNHDEHHDRTSVKSQKVYHVHQFLALFAETDTDIFRNIISIPCMQAAKHTLQGRSSFHLQKRIATIEEIEKAAPSHIILSPGPGRPSDAGVCEEAVKYFAGKIPVLGVCLGHQAICEAYGATVSYAKQLMHGKQSVIEVDNTDKILQNALKKTKIRAYSYVFKDNFLFVVIKRKNKSKLIDELALRLPLKE